MKKSGRAACVLAAGSCRAGSWSRVRRIICRVLVTANGEDMRFIVTSFTQAGAKYLYETVCYRGGAMELMIKGQKSGLHSAGCSRSGCASQAGRRASARTFPRPSPIFRSCVPLCPPTAAEPRPGGTLRVEIQK
ncbi:MAG: transposase [Pontiellaceae bacterium]|nr:transposase [Pontiellaceae bacterium]MBN2783529.1 transposase [Pontiellaceae bacterium]